MPQEIITPQSLKEATSEIAKRVNKERKPKGKELAVIEQKMSRQQSGRLGGLTNSLYKPDYDNKVIELMKEGASKAEVATEIGIAEGTLYEWIKQHNSFAQAVKKGETFSQAWFVKKGKANMDKRFFQTGLWTMFMKNMFGWTDRVATEVSGPNGQPITIIGGMLQPKIKKVTEVKNTEKANPITETLGTEQAIATQIEAK